MDSNNKTIFLAGVFNVELLRVTKKQQYQNFEKRSKAKQSIMFIKTTFT